MICYLFSLIILCTLQNVVTLEERYSKDLLLCRKCGTDIADAHYLFTKESPGARKTEKQHMFGRKNVTVQTLVNPFGINFDIITAEKASCDNLGLPQGADSWFPGYTWRICACPRCGQHLGWTFETVLDKKAEKPKDHIDQFHGLIMSNVLGENYAQLKQAALKHSAFIGVRHRFPYNDAEDIQNVNNI